MKYCIIVRELKLAISLLPQTYWNFFILWKTFRKFTSTLIKPKILPEYDINLTQAVLTRLHKIPCLINKRKSACSVLFLQSVWSAALIPGPAQWR